MKSPIIFRASFQQPKGPLNLSGWKVPGPIWVEIFHSKIGPPAEWKARRPGTPHIFEEISGQSTPKCLKDQVSAIYFEKQLTPWEAFDNSIPGRPELLDGDEWRTDSQGKVHLTEIRKTAARSTDCRE